MLTAALRRQRWQGPGGCFSMIKLASFCRPLILTPAADSLFLLGEFATAFSAVR